MAEIEIVRIPVAPGNAAALEAAIRERGNDYLGPPRCLGLTIGRAGGGDEIVAIVTWASKQAHEAAQKGDGAGRLFAAVERFAAGPPRLETLASERGLAGRLEGQVALVTGGAGGIGLAVVERFVAEGARVGVADINAHNFDAVKASLGDRVVTIEADLATPAGNQRTVDATIAAFGKLDTFVANAGVFDGFSDFAALDVERVFEAFDAVFNINVRGLVMGCRAALPHLAASGGSIIATLSNASLYPDGGGVMYVASKHAALGVVRQLAHELAPRVRVNAVAPGATKTGIMVPDTFGISLDQQSPEISAAIAGLVPLAKHSDAEDHAAAYVLLAARAESRAMTGTVIVSDGGLGIRGLRRVRGGDSLCDTLGLPPG